jgi:hypothetical protein
MGWYDSFRVAAGPDGSVWAVGLDLLSRFSRGSWEVWHRVSRQLPYNRVHTIAVDRAGRAWLPTDSGAASYYRGTWVSWPATSGTHVEVFADSFHNALSLREIDRTIAIAPDGAVWLAVNQGIARLARGVWSYWPSPDALFTINGLAFESDRAVLVASEGGLYRFGDGNWSHLAGDPNGDSFQTVAVAPDRSIWAGGGKGLYHLAAGRRESWTKRNSALPDDKVQTIVIDPQGTVWVGTNGGLARLRSGSWQIWTTANSPLPTNDVRSLAFDASGVLWIGTDFGVTRFRVPQSRPIVVDLVGVGEHVTESSRTLGVLAYDPSYLTRSDELSYVWVARRPGKNGAVVDSFFTHQPFRTFNFPYNGRATIRVSAIDQYGNASAPLEHRIEVSLPVTSSLTTLAIHALAILGGSGLLYMVLLFPLIVLYGRHSWARTALNSGIFLKFPLVHKSILDTRWARRRIFASYVQSAADEASLPNPYLPQVLIGKSAGTALTTTTMGVEELFAQRMRVLVLARSGTGKSVFLRYAVGAATRQFLQDGRWLPVLVDLRTAAIAGRSFEAVVQDELAGGGVELPADVLAFLLRKGGFLFLVDSINEIEAFTVKSTFHPFLMRDARNRVIFAGQQDVVEHPEIDIVGLDAVSADQARVYLEAVLGKDIWNQLSLEAQALATNPADLRLLAEVFVHGEPASAPTRRADLYREFLRSDSAFGPLRSRRGKEMQAVYAVAFRMLREMRQFVRVEVLGEWVDNELRLLGVDDSATMTDIVDRISRSRMFREEVRKSLVGVDHLIGFRHELIGKYLAANHLRQEVMYGGNALPPALLQVNADARFIDLFYFLIDELDSPNELNHVLSTVIEVGSESSVRVVAYALSNKPYFVDAVIRQKYHDARIQLDVQDAPGASRQYASR